MKMNKIIIASAIVSSVIFSGCATHKPFEIPIPKEKKYTSSSIVTNGFRFRGKTYNNIREITRADTAKVAGVKTAMIALEIVSLFAGSYVPIGDTKGFSKEQLIGSEINDANNTNRVLNPVYGLEEKIKQEIAKKVKANPALASTMYEYPIIISNIGNTWKLTYENLSGDASKSYVLSSDIAVSRYIVKRDNSESNATRTEKEEVCNYTSSPIAYELWTKDDYKLIGDTRQTIIDECMKKISLKIDQFIPANNK